MSAPTTTVDKVRRRLMDLSTTNPLVDDYTVLEEAIIAALTRFSQDRPRDDVVADVTGNGTGYYALTGGGAVLASWADGFSRVVSVEYPAAAVASGYTPTYLDNDLDWTYYASATVKYLRLRYAEPTASETLRVTYTAPHTHSTSTDTVPSSDLDALCDLSAHFACLALATKAAASQDSVIAADSTNYRDGQLRFKQQAEEWMKSYERRLNLKDGTAGAGATADWNRKSSSGWPFLTHSRRWR